MMQSIEFCKKLLSFFDKKTKVVTNLIITLAGRQDASSVVGLSAEELFSYEYSSVSDAIEHVNKQSFLADGHSIEYHFRQMMVDKFPPKVAGRYHLLATDVSSIPRPHSPCLPNREYVYQANNVIKGNKPVTLGYRLSCVSLSARAHTDSSWMLPLSMQKVAVDSTDNLTAIKQFDELLSDEQLPFKNELTVNCADSKYSNVIYLNGVAKHDNLVNIIRFAGNRIVFHQAKKPDGSPVGHPPWYGESFRLKEPETWHQADEELSIPFSTTKGRKLIARLKRWNNMLVTGKRDYPMHDKPFDLVRVEIVDALTGALVYEKPMWLSVWGKRRAELNLTQIYHAYGCRFDIEHFFRFGKQRLLLTSYQTTSEQHTQNWWHIVMMSYWLLYTARKEALPIAPKWQPYKTNSEQADWSPSQVQRGLPAIIRAFVKEHLIPKPRNNSSSRKKGTIIGKKQRHPVVKKSKTKKKKTIAA